MSEGGFEGVEPAEEDLTITSTATLGGLVCDIEATGVPEVMGDPLFQLTFFYEQEEQRISHVLVVAGGGRTIAVSTVLTVVQNYLDAANREHSEGNYGVPLDIVDRQIDTGESDPDLTEGDEDEQDQ